MAPPMPSLNRATSSATSGGYSLLDDDMDESMDPDDDDDGYGGTEGPPAMDPVELRKLFDSQVAEVADLTGVPPDDVRLFLRHFHYDSDAFTETFFDDPVTLRRRLGVSEIAPPPAGRSWSTAPLCGICFCEPAAPGVLPCSCDGYCLDCWRMYVSVAIEESKACLDLRCPTPKCGERLRPSQVQRLCASPALAERYDRFMIDSFVDESQVRKWCPGAGCKFACTSEQGSGSVFCKCGLEWCFACSNDAHQPVSCSLVQQWNKKTVDEGSNMQWILANTKNCPKCAHAIEKNGGCMHMTCDRAAGGCGYEFCWICMGDWKNHRVCNALEERQDVKDARHEIERYAHFWQRFAAQEHAQKASGELKSRIEAVMVCFTAEQVFAVKDVEFLAHAAAEIERCRRFLKWSYAFAYFLGKEANEPTRRLFEFHQGQLEGTLERLSDIVENTLWDEYLQSGVDSKQPFYKVREQTISLTGVVHNFFDSLMTWISEQFPENPVAA